MLLTSRRSRLFRSRSRGSNRRHPGLGRHPQMLRSPSFLVTSVAAIGGLSAIAAVPSADLAGEDATAVGSVAPITPEDEDLFAEVGAVTADPRIVLDTADPAVADLDGADPVQPVVAADVTLLGSGDELSSLALGGLGQGAGGAPGSDVFDPAEFTTFDADVAPEDDEDPQAGVALVYEGADGERIDPERIRTWLEGRNYPLADYSEELVAAGVEHDVDPRLVVGIAVIESSGGKRLPPSTHNAWGWGGDGPYGLRSWPSWPEAIDGFTEGFARVYDADNVDERMARKYVPPNWEKWLRTVRWVIDDI